MDPIDFPAGYSPRQELGEGSMGTVWLAYSERARGHCAIKVLNLHNDQRGSAERSFNREVRAMARLDHPAVIQVHDYGRTAKGSPFLAMEYVPGSSLHPYSRGPWTWGALHQLIEGLLAGLAHAHARELIHRDLKPGNILIVPDRVGLGAVKLVDFGIALGVAEAISAGRRIEGTPAYIAPEAASGDVAAIGPWTDLYSLGVILFEILTGDLPFHGRHLLTHHQRSPLPPIRVRDDVEAPAGLVPIVERLLEKSPVDRFRSVASLKLALATLPKPARPVPIGHPPSLIMWDEDEPVTEQEVLTPLSGPSGPGLFHLREPPLAGRSEAQKALRTAAEAVARGEGNYVALIEGEPGFGKSRLASWLREGVVESGELRAMVIRSEPQTTGAGLRQAVLRFLGAPTATEAEAEALLERVLPDEESRRNAMQALWLSGQTDQVNDTLIARGARLIRDLAADGPLLVQAEDAQWSPEGRILRLFHRLARVEGPGNLFLVATLRPTQRSTVRAARKALLSLPNALHVELGPVSPRDLAPALDALAPLPPGLAEGACILAAGNPLIALEAVRAYLESEGLGSAPSDPNAVLAERVERATRGPQGGALRSALARATLLGRSFGLSPLLKLCAVPGDLDAPDLPSDAEGIEALLERAVSAGLAVEQGVGRWRFSHDLVRAQLRQVCRGLSNWPKLNLAAAELKLSTAQADSTGIELEVAARHLWEGEQLGGALRLGLESVLRLHGSGLMGHASAFVRRLLDWDDKTQLLSAEDRCELRLLGSDAAEHAGQPAEAERHAQAAVGIAQRNYLPALGARAASRVGVLKLLDDEVEAAEHWLWDALRFARKSGDPRARANAHLSLGQFYIHRDQLDLAIAALEASLESASSSDLLPEALAARTALAKVDRREGRLEQATYRLERVLEDAQEASQEVAALDARLQLGLCAWLRDDPADAIKAFEEVRRGARGNLFALEFCACLGEAWSLAAQDRFSDADMVLIQAEDMRYDLRLRDEEVERLRRAIRTLAVENRRQDLVDRVDKLDVLVTRPHASASQRTHGTDQRFGPNTELGTQS